MRTRDAYSTCCRRCRAPAYGMAALCASCTRWRALLTQHEARQVARARAERPLRRGQR